MPFASILKSYVIYLHDQQYGVKILSSKLPILKPSIDSLLLASQYSLYLLHLPRISHTYWTLDAVQSLSDISIICFNPLSMTEKSDQRIPKDNDGTILSSQKRSINPDDIPIDDVKATFISKPRLLVLTKKGFHPILEDPKSLFHRQISNNRSLYYSSTYCRRESKKTDEN